MTIANIRELLQQGARVEHLRLETGSLEELADILPWLPDLNQLSITDAKLSELPDTIALCQKLGRLQISNAGLARLPRNLGQCRGLHSISIVQNKLRQLPASLSECLNLRSLKIELGRLEEFPGWAVQLPWIREISFRNNRLSSIPEAPWACHLLAELNLNHNRISSLPRNISLPKLEALHLRGNHLSELPEEWLQSPQLKYLDIAHNPIGYLPQLPNTLQHLDISGCPIAGYPEGLFELTELRSFRGAGPDARKLPVFMAACRRTPVPLAWRSRLFDAFCGRAEALSLLSREQCLKALQWSPPQFRTALVTHIKSGNPSANVWGAGAKLALTGKFSEPLKTLHARLKKSGIQVVPVSDAGWIVLGRPPYIWPDSWPPACSILTEDDLQYLRQDALAIPLDKRQTDQLRELLLHPNETNVELALLMLNSVPLPAGLHTALLCAKTRVRSTRLKRIISEKLRAVTPVQEWHILRMPFSAWMRRPPREAASLITRQLDGSSFDGAQMYQWLSEGR